MRSTFFSILLIFSPPEGYRLQFSIPRAYFVYGTVLANTAVLCMRVCIVSVPVRGAPLMSVITTLYYVASIFHCCVWYRALYLRYAYIRSTSIILIP